MSSHEHIFCITASLWRESTSDCALELWYFLLCQICCWTNSQVVCDLRHCNTHLTSMYKLYTTKQTRLVNKFFITQNATRQWRLWQWCLYKWCLCYIEITPHAYRFYLWVLPEILTAAKNPCKQDSTTCHWYDNITDNDTKYIRMPLEITGNYWLINTGWYHICTGGLDNDYKHDKR